MTAATQLNSDILSSVKTHHMEITALVCGHRSSSTDMGDISMKISAQNDFSSGYPDSPHTADFPVCDPGKTYIQELEFSAMDAVSLRCRKDKNARRVIESFKPMDKKTYFKYKHGFYSTKELNYDKL